ncbi:MAG TPA: SpoIIE family protein phosphatase [Solirubrobacterales bacterium]|nr:SpoIIE family protein phosphatase [Solirubrobacterales bacterium]
MFRTASGPSEWPATGIAAGVLAALVGLDVALGPDAILATSFVLAAFVTALTGAVRGTAVVAAAAYALIAASGAWNDNFGATDYDVRLVIAGPALAFAIFAARARREAQHNMRRFQLLDDVTSVADGSLPVHETVDRIASVVVPEVADICMIDVTSGGRANRIAVRATGPDREAIEARLSRRRPSIPAEMSATDENAVVPPLFRPRHDEATLRDIAHDEQDLRFVRSLESTSSITVPLVARKRRLGALTLVAARSARRYRPDDVRFARVLADRIALALDNAGLFTDLESVERRMDTVMAVLDEAVVIEDGEKNFLFANSAAARLFGLESEDGLIGSSFQRLADEVDLYDEDGNPLDLERFAEARRQSSEAGPVTFRAISRESGRETWLRARSRAVPGADGAPVWTATAFEDVSDLKQAEFAQTMLARTGELLSSNDYEETLKGIAALAIPQLADWCSVHVVAPDGSIEELALAHRDPERIAAIRRLGAEYPLHTADDSPVAEVLRTRRPLVARDITPQLEAMARSPDHLRRLEELGLGSLMVMPLRLGGEMRGTLNLINDTDRRPFDDFDVELAGRIADRAAVALENARLATERSEIAETLQHGLLPSPIPEIPGWSVAALYRPAGEQNEVGGDFYEVFPFEQGWIVAIGDVTGRGAGAASITALARHTLRTAAALTGDPRTALAALNRALLARSDLSLCTVALVALRAASPGEAEVISAGHPPPLLIEEGAVRQLPCHGPVLGAFDGAGWESASVALEPGDLLVAFTDGVTEAEAGGERFGEDRLRGQLAGLASPAETVRRVELSLEAFTGGQLRDDAAIVAIMRDPDPLSAQSLAALRSFEAETGATV